MFVKSAELFDQLCFWLLLLRTRVTVFDFYKKRTKFLKKSLRSDYVRCKFTHRKHWKSSIWMTKVYWILKTNILESFYEIRKLTISNPIFAMMAKYYQTLNHEFLSDWSNVSETKKTLCQDSLFYQISSITLVDNFWKKLELFFTIFWIWTWFIHLF